MCGKPPTMMRCMPLQPRLGLLGLLALVPLLASAQGIGRFLALSENFYRSGDALLTSFSPTVATARYSVVQILLDEKPAALGVVVDTNGLIITKASELKEGKLTAQLADGRTAALTGLVNDARNDVALVKLDVTGLKPVIWSDETVALGQWMVTTGTGTKPEAVGVLSAATRKLHRRAIIGVLLDVEAPQARIAEVQRNYGAAQAGLQAGDVILLVNGTPVKDSDELRTTLRDFHAGQIIELLVRRENQEFYASVEMKPESASVTLSRGRGSGRSGGANRFVGELSQRAEDFELAMQHDTVLQPWQCGGPLLNLDGKAVGLNIARAGRIASYALPASLVKRIIAELKSRPLQPLNDETGDDG